MTLQQAPGEHVTKQHYTLQWLMSSCWEESFLLDIPVPWATVIHCDATAPTCLAASYFQFLYTVLH